MKNSIFPQLHRQVTKKNFSIILLGYEFPIPRSHTHTHKPPSLEICNFTTAWQTSLGHWLGLPLAARVCVCVCVPECRQVAANTLLALFLQGSLPFQKRTLPCKAASYLKPELFTFILGPTWQLPEPPHNFSAAFVAPSGLCNLCGSLLGGMGE